MFDHSPSSATKDDLVLIFPPQWSPYQPFLSSPSLKAYLDERGYAVRQEDWNLAFYNWFIAPERVVRARSRLNRYVHRLPPERSAYRNDSLYALSTLERYDALAGEVAALRFRDTFEDVGATQRSVYAFNELLNAFTVAEPVVRITATSLDVGPALTSFETLDAFTADRVRNPFVPFFESQMERIEAAPRYFGISIIGTEQIVPGLTLSRLLKQHFPEVPVILGGSVFSRIVEKPDSGVERLFGAYFDFVCRYEGERPLEIFLASTDPKRDDVPNIAFVTNGELKLNPLCEPLDMADVPTPSFDGLPLDQYLTPEVVLPILSTRGCYWGKCAFCYHGMIYQERYRARSPELVAADVVRLSERYGARHFSFNDEALPPKLFRTLPAAMPPNRFYFTALYKFEKFFRPEDYQRMYDIGFRSLYIGLESASERMQRHMRKNNKQETMVRNLKDAHEAGIWNHTFNFFGFPTETDDDADETIRFLLDHADILHSEGTGTFAFEHNAAIFQNPSAFGVKNVRERKGSVLELYYDYDVESGLDAEGAQSALERFKEQREARKLYRYGTWIPREYLLLLLSYHERDNLKDKLARCEVEAVDRAVPLGEALIPFIAELNGEDLPRHFLVNRITRRIFETDEATFNELRKLDPSTQVAIEQSIAEVADRIAV
jgi:hypothetical protein